MASRSGTERGPEDTIEILSARMTSGSITSTPITPTLGAERWATLHFSATVGFWHGHQRGYAPTATAQCFWQMSLMVPIFLGWSWLVTLASDFAQGWAAQAGQTPRLREWSVGWISSEHRVYLPLIMRL